MKNSDRGGMDVLKMTILHCGRRSARGGWHGRERSKNPNLARRFALQEVDVVLPHKVRRVTTGFKVVCPSS